MITEKEKLRRAKISKTLSKYLATPEGKEQRRKTSTGKKHSKETKEKLSKLRTGEGNGMYKKHHSKEAKQKITEAMKIRKITWGNKISESLKGRIISPEQKKQISKKLIEHYKTNPSPWKGKHHSEESKQKMREANLGKYDGPNHPQWRGGITHDPYCFSWPEITKAIKERDNNTCQNPNCKTNSNDLTTHHINYIKEECEGTNLITLCRSCNAKANFYRRKHKIFYQNILIERGILKKPRRRNHEKIS